MFEMYENVFAHRCSMNCNNPQHVSGRSGRRAHHASAHSNRDHPADVGWPLLLPHRHRLQLSSPTVRPSLLASVPPAPLQHLRDGKESIVSPGRPMQRTGTSQHGPSKELFNPYNPAPPRPSIYFTRLWPEVITLSFLFHFVPTSLQSRIVRHCVACSIFPVWQHLDSSVQYVHMNTMCSVRAVRLQAASRSPTVCQAVGNLWKPSWIHSHLFERHHSIGDVLSFGHLRLRNVVISATVSLFFFTKRLNERVTVLWRTLHSSCCVGILMTAKASFMFYFLGRNITVILFWSPCVWKCDICDHCWLVFMAAAINYFNNWWIR